MADEIKTCVIIGAAPVCEETIKELLPQQFYLICADGGFDTAQKFGLHSNLVVGDFDSAKNVPNENENVIRLPVEKDETDMLYAVKQAMQKGYRNLILLGGLGGERFDHSIANLCVLSYIANHGGNAVMADRQTRAFVITEGKITFTDLKDQILSVFPFGTLSCTVTYTGLQYPLIRETIFLDDALGVSNKIIEDKAEIFLHSGHALILLHIDKP